MCAFAQRADDRLTLDGAARRLELGPGGALTPDDLADRWQRDFATWPEPRPVVFLMACSSMVSDASLLGGFAEQLHCAGARAIVGTEAPAFPALVSEFATTVGRAWWAGEATLGEAIRRYRAALMARGNPLGFVFTALGNADLVLSKGAAS